MQEENTPMANDAQPAPSLTISDNGVNYLTETRKWTKFLSILGFVLTGIIVIMAFSVGSIMASIPGGQMENMPAGMGVLFTVVYLLLGLLYFFPAWYLFQFSQKLESALSTNNNDDLSIALSKQKSFYKFWGILMIVFIGLYVIIGLFALLAVALK